MIDRKKHIEELVDGAQLLKRKAISHALMKDASITGSQWLVIGQVFRSEGCTISDVAAELNMTGSAVTQLVNGLVKKGYLRREVNPDDKRSQRLVLSQQSRKHMSVLKAKRVRMMLGMFEALTDREFATYVELNQKILGTLRKK